MWWHLGAGRAYCPLSVRREASFSIILALKSTLSGHYRTWNPKNDPVMTHVVITWRTPKQVFTCLTRSPKLWCLGVLRRHAMLHRCSGAIHQCSTMWRAKQCSTEQCHDGSTAETHLCLFFSQRAAKLRRPWRFRRITHLPKGELWSLHQSWADLWEKNLVLTKQGGKIKMFLAHTQRDKRFYPPLMVAQGYPNKLIT